MEKNETIECCPECGNPLISTFIIFSAEWFCFKCKWAGGIFDSITKNWTENRQIKYNQLKKDFDNAVKGYVPPGCKYENCDKCNRNELKTDKYHLWHLTKIEKTAHEKARKLLFFQHNKIVRN